MFHVTLVLEPENRPASIGGQYRGTFLVPVPRYFAIFLRYRYFSFVLFFRRDFKKLIKNLKRRKNACK